MIPVVSNRADHPMALDAEPAHRPVLAARPAGMQKARLLRPRFLQQEKRRGKNEKDG